MTTVKGSSLQSISDLIKIYINEKNKFEKHQNLEFEVKFGTKKIKKLKKENFDQVIKYLMSNGFSIKEDNQFYLNISYETVRVRIEGISNVQDYCKTGIIPTDRSDNYQFSEKKTFKLQDGSPAIFNVDDFNLRASLAIETQLFSDSTTVRSLISDWSRIKKFNRLITRYTMVKEGFPLQIDLSIVKETPDIGKSFRDINLGNLIEKYEIEIELDNALVGDLDISIVDQFIKKVNKIVLSGLQNTNYPISYPNIETIKQSYKNLILSIPKNKYTYDHEILPKDFIGPSSSTLQINNIIEENKNLNFVNIRKNYTVTEKADGERKLLFVDDDGKIYLITTLMNIEFTGAITNNDKLYNSLIDGEHIIHNKIGQFINLYAAFDIYFVNRKDLRDLEFISGELSESGQILKQSRWNLLDNFIKSINSISIIKGNLSPIRIQMKTFYGDSEDQSIFDCCKIILNEEKNNLFEYETDGLIFTPKSLGVGQTPSDKRIKNYKYTWQYSLKWKPAKFNTIDFLITTKKSSSGIDIIGNKFKNGVNVNSSNQILQYKTVILRVGYDQKKHGYLNPCQNIINDEIQIKSDVDNEQKYKPVQFYPSNPYDPSAGICNIDLKQDEFGENKMFTQNGEVIEDNTIVEFSYNPDEEKGWRWLPLRVRYDKTAEYKAGFPQFGNAYHVADSNWHSIHNPVTETMISEGKDIPTKLDNDDIYYNTIGTKSDNTTKALRDFHNLFVKNNLISSISNPGDSLIDYAVGKGGDLPKWVSAKLSFVFGIDSSKDNIRNSIDGVCARYLNYKLKFEQVPDALFIYGDSSKNIKDLDAAYNDVGKNIIKSIFGVGVKDEKIIGRGVLKSFGKVRDGFNISSIQFAIHYMFESPQILHNFLTNVSECTKLNGYFIGTCFNGKKVFDLLKKLKVNETYTFFAKDKKNKLLEITKKYESDKFEDNITSLNYGIDIFQNSINKTFREYLVNFDFFQDILQSYGFIPLNSEELSKIGIPYSYGSFEILYNIMESDIKSKKINQSNYGQASKMSSEEKNISFLNNYFIFKKVRNVSSEDSKLSLLSKDIDEDKSKYSPELLEKEEIKTTLKDTEKSTSIKPPSLKLKKKQTEK